MLLAQTEVVNHELLPSVGDRLVGFPKGTNEEEVGMMMFVAGGQDFTKTLQLIVRKT